MKSFTYTLEIHSHQSNELIDITNMVEKLVVESKVNSGTAMLFVPHTTAAVTINENADPDVKRDLLMGLNKTFPNDKNYHHLEGNSDAHLKSSVIGIEKTLIIENSRLLLGTWQGIYFCEFDGPRNRKVYIRINGE